MMDRLFGPHRSVQRQVCIALSAVVILLGIIAIPLLGAFEGFATILVGVLAGAILARLAENRVAARASAELLSSLDAPLDEEGARRLAEGTRASASTGLPTVGEQAGVDDGSLPWSDEAGAPG